MEKDSRFSSPAYDEDKYRVIYPALVIDNQDPIDAMRIKVKILDLREDRYNDEDLPWCTSILGKTFIELPKIGEVVMVLLGNIERPLSERYWFPRQISSYENQSGEYGIESAMRGTVHSVFENPRVVSKNNKALYLYPQKTDKNKTWLLGRNNVDISFDDMEYQLRVLKHNDGSPL